MAAICGRPRRRPLAITPPAGLLVQEHTEGAEIIDNLDALSDAVALTESHSGTADLIIASPVSWSAVSKLKTGFLALLGCRSLCAAADGNESVLGPAAVAAQRRPCPTTCCWWLTGAPSCRPTGRCSWR
jgi:hypothetical protein